MRPLQTCDLHERRASTSVQLVHTEVVYQSQHNLDITYASRSYLAQLCSWRYVLDMAP